MKRTKRTILVICMVALMMMFAAVPAMAANTGTDWTLTDNENPSVTINIAIEKTGNNTVFNLTLFVDGEETISKTVPGNESGSGTFVAYVAIGGYTIRIPVQGNEMGKNGFPEIIEKSICDHDWDYGVVTKPATCVREGLMTYTCSKCGVTYTEVIAIDPDNHVGGTYKKVITAATYFDAGEMGIYCKSCKELIKTLVIPKLTATGASASYNKNLQDKGNQNLTFTITLTLSDETTLNFNHAEKVNGGQKGTKTFEYDDYTVVAVWNDNNMVTSMAVTLK